MASNQSVVSGRPVHSSRRLHVGVLGLGRAWRQRYRTALAALSERFHVGAVGDAVTLRAEQEARQLQCAAVAGPAELLESADLDAVLLLDAPWYRLWPLQLACRFGKPVFCAPPLDVDDAHADHLLQQVRQHRLAVMTALAPRLATPTTRLRELLQRELGPARLVLCDCTHPLGRPRRAASEGPTSLLGPHGLALIDWCLALVPSAPTSVQVAEAAAAELTTVVLEFAGGQAAQLVRRRAAGPTSRLRLEVVAEGGRARIELPNRIDWTTNSGVHRHRLTGTISPTRLLLERFHATLTEGGALLPNFDDAFRALTCLRAAQRSRTEGRRVEVAAG